MIAPVMPVYARLDTVFERGEGPYLFDDAGRRYLDFASGIAVTALGHAHPRLVETLKRQGERLWHTSNLFRVGGQETLAAKLVQHSFADTVFFTNSGVEAWECGAKLIRRHFYAKGQAQKNRIITVEGAFHGRTLGAISAAKSEKLVKGFGPLLDGFDQVPFGNLNMLRDAIAPETAGILVEPILGEGGIRVAPSDYLKGLRAACDEFGLLLFFDEIQTGMGRTGTLFAYEQAGVQPDVMCIAKGIGGGFPLGACLATEAAASGMTAGSHGSTYGGSPLATAVGETVMDVMTEPGFLDHVVAMGQEMRAMLERVAGRHRSSIAEVRGLGLLLGLKLAPSLTPAALVEAAHARGLVTVGAADNAVRILPPLIIENAQVQEGEALLEETLQSLEAA